MKITVGIKALNEERQIAAALNSAIEAIRTFEGEVILADSGSTDQTIAIAKTFPVRIYQLATPSERSCGTGAQLAFQSALGEYFYLLDGDMVLAREFLPAGIAYLEANPDVAGVGGLVREVNTETEEYKIRAKTTQTDPNRRAGIVDRLDCGGLYRMLAIKDLGYFTDQNLHAFEEFELGARLQSKGWRLARLDLPAVDHFGHTTGSFQLLWRRLKSGYVDAHGEVLRSAIGKPYLQFVLRRLTQIRNSAAVIAWWVLLLFAAFFHPIAALALLIAPLMFLAIRRRSLRLGAYSFAVWNAYAWGFLSGLCRRRVPPERTIASIEICNDFNATSHSKFALPETKDRTRACMSTSPSLNPSYRSASGSIGAGTQRNPLKRVMVIAPHYQEYSLLFANALSRHARVMLFIEQKRLSRAYAGRTMPIAPDLSIRDVTLTSIMDVFRILFNVFRFRPSVIHLQEASGLRRAIVSACVVTLTRPFCTIALTVHDPIPHPGRDAAFAARLRHFRTYVRKCAHVILVHGKYCYDEYVAHSQFSHQKILITAHGTILSDANAVETSRDVCCILFFGRMEAYKGVDVLCEAAEILSREGVQFRLRIAGGGPELDRLEWRFKKIPQVELINAFFPAKALIETIQDCDCVVMPYLSATQSGVLSAAFANGRCVVASSVGGIPDVVEHMKNGLLVPPNDPKALAEALKRLASNSDLRETLKEGARLTGQTRLHWDRIVEDVVATY